MYHATGQGFKTTKKDRLKHIFLYLCFQFLRKERARLIFYELFVAFRAFSRVRQEITRTQKNATPWQKRFLLAVKERGRWKVVFIPFPLPIFALLYLLPCILLYFDSIELSTKFIDKAHICNGLNENKLTLLGYFCYSWQHINESKLLHTYVMNEVLAASCSRLTKCFKKTLYQDL